ncbi:Tannase/feruloyl esterase [Macrophomina phaseolina]|uniref:Carboxylic ester hydrolase n=1 Tax=Macrophomina phaseolina TaxID=35725 RepID=A0ABQ8GR77_9PEZI|nr:Tannase/feruloyl esterase [Macrophomina phaseolina]
MAPGLLTSSLALFASVVGAATTSTDSFQQSCLSFEPQKHVYNSTLTVREFVPANTTLTFPDNDATCNRASQLVSADVCRIAMSIPTSERSSITYEMWLPRDWSGRFLATGNGGIDGCVKYEDLAYTSLNGFAAVGANNGHNGTYGNAFYRNEEVVRDFAWRSLHTATDVGKKLTKLFYEGEISKSYYLGCSLGGRMGIKAAEKFPDDFDGIVAGAPAVDFNDLISWRASFYPITGAIGSENFISADTWKTTIHNEVLAQCDAIDGVEDGIIEDPTLCHFNPATLLCSATTTNSSTCLNAIQVGILQQIFSPFFALNGDLIFPGMQPGSETGAVERLYAGKPFSYSEDWFKYVLYNPSWDASTFTALDALYADARNPANIRTWPSSLARFQKRGGKLLSYHGQQDNQITSFNTPRFYEYLRKSMRYGYADMDAFFRFFRVSGMNHCNGGPGAWVLGQGGGAPAAGIPFDAEHNVLAAMVDWVEKGEAPEGITGTKFADDKVAEGVAFERTHCKYPLRNTFRGEGRDPSDPASWECSCNLILLFTLLRRLQALGI